MAKIKLTKNELKKQKDALKRFERYLPTLLLKKQQLQLVIRQVDQKIFEIKSRQDVLTSQISTWIAVFGEKNTITEILSLESIIIEDGNIAGVQIPVFKDVNFLIRPYDLLSTSFWIDDALVHLQELLSLEAEIEVLKKQQNALAEELRVTSQRVNLFEKIKIPETRKNIKKIRIYLGDEQTAAVVRGKIAKANIVQVIRI
ncbi:MAG: V-type ATP synthase subunit D [Spirochaetales bacterium]|nr:V-type ATP synthase subunit D [Spirochaetales bacterium]